MPDESRLKTFLKSGPGILTAAATFIAAVTGLITALTQLGGGSPPSAAKGEVVAQTTAQASIEDPVQRDLLSRVPDSIRGTCGRPTSEEETAVAAVNCTYRAVVGIQYNLFASTNELEADYRDVKDRYGLAGGLGGGTCGAGRFEGDYRDAGRMLCFVGDDGVASIVWTDRTSDIMAFAWRDDGKLAALYEAWQTGFGPE